MFAFTKLKKNTRCNLLKSNDSHLCQKHRNLCIYVTESGVSCKDTKIQNILHCMRHDDILNNNSLNICINTSRKGTRCDQLKSNNLDLCKKHHELCNYVSESGVACKDKKIFEKSHCIRHDKMLIKTYANIYF